MVTAFKSTSARVKICERHFGRHCGNYVVFSVFCILLAACIVGCVQARSQGGARGAAAPPPEKIELQKK